MDLVCYLNPGWAPLIRPAPATRAWMDDTPESFAYRCLPLNIANAHGWEVLTPHGFEAEWDGGSGVEAVTVRPDGGGAPERMAVSLFGQGVLTFHVEGVIRTPPGWSLWITGSPNREKDAIQPLTGMVETDWSPFTFTMNWRFTRARQPVRFEAMEPFCFLFPVERAAIETFEPRLAPMTTEADLAERFGAWSASRDAFQARMRETPPTAPADRWQKHYYQGVDVSGGAPAPGHRTKLRLRPFDAGTTPQITPPPLEDAQAPPPRRPVASPDDEIARLRLALAKREWLLETLERQRDLAPGAVGIERRADLEADEFLERYYAANRPVILTGEMDGWPALTKWTPDYLRSRIGEGEVEYQGEREANPLFERQKARHLRRAPFSEFLDRLQAQGAGNDAYITAFNSAANAEALAILSSDLGRLDKLLDHDLPGGDGMMWIGPEGTFTALHHDLTNNLIAQVIGRKRVMLIPAAEVGRLYNDQHVFSRIADVEDPALDAALLPRLAGVRGYPVELAPGEMLFTPLGWWHQVRALEFSVTVTYTNFRWPNDGGAGFPAD